MRARLGRRCGCTALINTLFISFNLSGIILDLLLFPQTGQARPSDGWCDYALSASIVFHAYTLAIYATDIIKPLRISFRFCAQVIVYMIAAAINVYHFGWILTSIKTKPTPCATVTVVTVEYEVGVVLIWEMAVSLTNFVWLCALILVSSCHHCRITELNESENELVEIAVNHSLVDIRSRTTSSSSSSSSGSNNNNKPFPLDPEQFTADDIQTCLTIIKPPPSPPSSVKPLDTPSPASASAVTAHLIDSDSIAIKDIELPGSAPPAITLDKSLKPVPLHATVREVKVCGHRFHEECIMRWMLTHRNNTCPICRAHIVVRLPTGVAFPTPRPSPPLQITHDSSDRSEQCIICTDPLWMLPPCH